MKKIILVTACVAAMSGFATLGASAETTGPQSRQTMKAGDPMNANARMRHHRRHHMGMMKGEMREGGMKKEGGMMKEGGMKKDGMAK